MGEDLERIGDGVKNLSPEEAEAIYKDQDRGAVPCYDHRTTAISRTSSHGIW